MSNPITANGRRRVNAALALVGAVAGLFASTLSADAGRIRAWRDHGYNGLEKGYVVARSRFGNGSISGPVRVTSLGPQVRLPGGTWEYCRRSCSETLRVETVDQWEARQGIGKECGIFGCLSVGVGRD